MNGETHELVRPAPAFGADDDHHAQGATSLLAVDR
jgi:hypothetical protein